MPKLQPLARPGRRSDLRRISRWGAGTDRNERSDPRQRVPGGPRHSLPTKGLTTGRPRHTVRCRPDSLRRNRQHGRSSLYWEGAAYPGRAFIWTGYSPLAWFGEPRGGTSSAAREELTNIHRNRLARGPSAPDVQAAPTVRNIGHNVGHIRGGCVRGNRKGLTAKTVRPCFCNTNFWSGREDLNLRPPAPHAGTLPGCATPRKKKIITDSWPI